MAKIKSKYKRGDEFTIRIEEIHTHYSDNGNPFSLYRAKGFSSLVFDDKGLDKLERKIEKDITDKDYHKEYDTISCPHCGMTLVRFVCMSHHYCYVCGGKFGEININRGRVMMDRISCDGCEHYLEEEEYRYCFKLEKYIHYSVECDEESEEEK